MEQSRPKSGVLKTGLAEQRRQSSKYEQRRYSKDICKSINILPIKSIFLLYLVLNQNISSDKQMSDTIKMTNITSTKSGFVNKENANNRKKTLLSIKSKPSLKLDDNDDFKALIEQQDSIVSEKNCFSNTFSHKGKRPSI